MLERAQGPARETSFANGGMLTPGMCEPWNAPGVVAVLLRSLGRSDAALQLRLRTLAALIGWGMSVSAQFDSRGVRAQSSQQPAPGDVLARSDASRCGEQRASSTAARRGEAWGFFAIGPRSSMAARRGEQAVVRLD